MIDRDSPTPFYLQIADELAQRIANRELGSPRQVPSESEIRAEFEVARGTARRAIATLRAQRLVTTHPQRGGSAAEPPEAASPTE